MSANERESSHVVRQAVLRRIAARLLANVRDLDTVVRLGGDEFAHNNSRRSLLSRMKAANALCNAAVPLRVRVAG